MVGLEDAFGPSHFLSQWFLMSPLLISSITMSRYSKKTLPHRDIKANNINLQTFKTVGQRGTNALNLHHHMIFRAFSNRFTDQKCFALSCTILWVASNHSSSRGDKASISTCEDPGQTTVF